MYLDDILVTGETEEDHIRNWKLLSRLESAGIRLKREKCAFMQPSSGIWGTWDFGKRTETDGREIRAIVDALCDRRVGN